MVCPATSFENHHVEPGRGPTEWGGQLLIGSIFASSIEAFRAKAPLA
jgi:hypothetical protein